MGYYTRVLTPTARGVSVEELRAILKAEALKASLEVEDGPANDWTGLVLGDQSGLEIAAIDRNPVGPGTLGKAEIEEFQW